MTSKLRDSLAQQLRLPTQGPMGWIALQFLKYANSVLEKKAAQVCDIEPHHKVLEIGFGPGIGIEHAVKYIKDGPGKICGVDLSAYMVEKAAARLRKPVCEGKVELSQGNVTDLPYSNATFHRVFHCNCYYFWPTMQDALQEIYRVMKPEGMMVTLLSLEMVQRVQARGLLKYGNPDPVIYMTALELTGFKDVRMEYFSEHSISYQAIFAHLPVKPAVEYDLAEDLESVDSMRDEASKLNQNKDVHGLLKDPSSHEK